MKELSIEEKAKRYDEALKVLHKYDGAHIMFTQDLKEEMFPELKESEDERIRKALIRYFTLSDEHAYNEACGVSYRDIVAYLEKQGEQKPDDLKTKAGNWYVCDMEVMNENMVTAFHRNEIYYCPKDGYLDVRGALFEVGCLDVFRLATEKEIPQTKQEWSEEDEKMLKRLCRIVHSQRVEKVITLKEESELGKWMDKWLNHNPQPHWKPSELQIEALAIAIRCGIKLGTWEEEALKDLIEQLKRLREE